MWYNIFMSRRTILAPHEQYHLYNRGNNKEEVFHSRDDCIRFLFYILYLQSPVAFPEVSRHAAAFRRSGTFAVPEEVERDVIARRFVVLRAFCLMPNHFHLLVEERADGGISKYMQRVLNGYSKYANVKYPKRHIGHVFQGPFKSVRQKRNEQLLYLSAYLHRNPREQKDWRGKEHEYPWSSFQDFVAVNRWRDLLMPDLILEQFQSGKGYKQFVDTSPAKAEYNKELFDDDIVFGVEMEKGEKSV